MSASSQSRALRFGLLTLTTLAVSMAVPAIVTAAESDEGSLIIDDVMPGFEPTDTGEFHGPLDGGMLLELTGTDPDDVPQGARSLHGQAQTWEDAAGTSAIVLVMTNDSVSMASAMLKGAIDAAREHDGTKFSTDAGGMAAYTFVDSGLSVGSVLWRQENYFVEVIVVSGNVATTKRVAKSFATGEADLLRSRGGDEPTVETSSAGSNSDKSGVAYQIGYLIGLLFPAIIATLVVMHARRQRAERRAHVARFSVPPPTFNQLPTTDVASMPAVANLGVATWDPPSGEPSRT